MKIREKSVYHVPFLAYAERKRFSFYNLFNLNMKCISRTPRRDHQFHEDKKQKSTVSVLAHLN